VQNISTPMLVVAAALIRGDGAVLLHRRAFEAVHGGLWEFPGGKVSGGESLKNALVRELSEELDICVSQDDLVPLGFASGLTEGELIPRTLVILLYTCAAWTGEPRCMEGAGMGWFDPAAIAALDMPPLDYPLARQLTDRLDRGAG
jgi:8-oxo-dGTP diphosphatase